MGPELNGFTVGILLYGDNYDLARRCLGSVVHFGNPELIKSLRVGLNACCKRTRDYVHDVLRAADLPGLVYDAGEVNRLKYPVMRKMFYDPANPVTTQYTMWFDDDSYLTDDCGDSRWWTWVYAAMHDADMLGAVYAMPQQGQQWRHIQQQPWYKGRPVGPNYNYKFATGGWWCCRTRILQQWNYPWPELIHNGGDTLLGELVRQQGYKLNHFRVGLAINADSQGRESKAPRRGESRPPLWAGPVDASPDLSHHAFELHGVDPKATAADRAAEHAPSKLIQIPGF